MEWNRNAKGNVIGNVERRWVGLGGWVGLGPGPGILTYMGPPWALDPHLSGPDDFEPFACLRNQRRSLSPDAMWGAMCMRVAVAQISHHERGESILVSTVKLTSVNSFTATPHGATGPGAQGAQGPPGLPGGAQGVI